jgi:hypothetical protein
MTTFCVRLPILASVTMSLFLVCDSTVLARDPNEPLPPPWLTSFVDGDFYNGTGILAMNGSCLVYYDENFCKKDGRVCMVTLADYQGYHADGSTLTPWVHVSGFIRNNYSTCFVPQLVDNTIDPVSHCDFNGDGKTDFMDYAFLMKAWAATCTYRNVPLGAAWCYGRDINRDGKVDSQDLEEFADNWLLKQFWIP